MVDIFPKNVAAGINSTFIMIWWFDISLDIRMYELPPRRLCLASPMNIIHQPIHRSFLIKWSRFWLALLLNFCTKTINYINIKIKRRSASR